MNKESGDGFKLEISKLSDQYVTEPFPSLIYTEEETEELAIIGTDIGGYILHMRAKWIMEGGIEAEWDEYVDQLNSMGLERLIEIRMAAYERSK